MSFMAGVSPAERPGSRWDVLACLACAVVGMLLSIAPHLAAVARYGTLEYINDDDDVFYLSASRAAYHGEDRMRDPFCGRWEGVATYYTWMPIVPLAKASRALGLPLILVSLVWRFLGGALLGLALFLLFRRLFAATRWPTAWALGCSLVCLADGGFGDGRSLIGDFLLFRHLLAGTTPRLRPDALPQYRIIPPLLTLPFLLLMVASLLPEERRSGPRSILLGAASLGLCFLMYFYQWTGAVLALGIFILLFLAGGLRAREGRAHFRKARAAALVLAGGIGIGIPQVSSNMRTFDQESSRSILARMYRPTPLARNDPRRGCYLENRWIWAKLALGAFGIVILRLPSLRLLWSVAFAGYVLANGALLTGLDFENFHWHYVSQPAAELLLLGTLVLWLDLRSGLGPRSLRALWVVPGLLLPIAAVWRPYEALHAPDAVRYNRLLQELRPLRRSLAAMDTDSSLAGSSTAKLAILYSRNAILYASPSMWTCLIPDDELHRRHALNGWLTGLDTRAYSDWAGKDLCFGDDLPQTHLGPKAVRKARVSIFDSLTNARTPPPWIDPYRPLYLLLPTTSSRPLRGGPWFLVQRSPNWALWSRHPTAGVAPGG